MQYKSLITFITLINIFMATTGCSNSSARITASPCKNMKVKPFYVRGVWLNEK